MAEAQAAQQEGRGDPSSISQEPAEDPELQARLEEVRRQARQAGLPPSLLKLLEAKTVAAFKEGKEIDFTLVRDREAVDDPVKAKLLARLKGQIDGGVEDPPPIPSAPPETTVDFDWNLRRLDGGEVTLSEFRGRTIFLGLWATWCAPCLAELPSIQRLYESHQGGEYVFLLISDEEAEPVRRLIEEKGWSFPVYLTGAERPELFAEGAVPRIYVINPAGELALFQRGGPHRWDAPSFVEYFESWSR